ncbi:MAG: ABC transporter permease subunit [Clostridia bacterium]|nr:ABC transporter permease subunit [Clostridia bacterium]
MISNALTVFLKELKCMIRDKKTFWMISLLPFVLIPLMLLTINFSTQNLENNMGKNMTVGISSKDNTFYDFLSVQKALTVLEVTDPQKSLNSGEIVAYITTDNNLDEKFLKKEKFTIDIQYSDSSINSKMAMAVLPQYESTFRYISENYDFDNINSFKEKISSELDVSDDLGVDISSDNSMIYFNMLVPVLLVIYCWMGSSTVAAELTAGEKEKGTLEPLLSNGVERTSLIIGKIAATTAMGVISGMSSVLGLGVYLLISSSFGKVGMNVLDLLALLFVAILASVFFSSVNIMLGIYARSSKEAQAYFMPSLLVYLIPTFFTYTLDVNQINLPQLCIPVYNIICVIKEIMASSLNIVHLVVVTAWFAVYISLAYFVTIRLFKREDVIFRI